MIEAHEKNKATKKATMIEAHEKKKATKKSDNDWGSREKERNK